jgi:hypothetical protein
MAVDGMAGSIPAKSGGPEDIQTAWKILAGGAPVAAAALVDIAEHGKSEVARVQAATAVLDRVGLATPKERPQVTFAVIPKEFDQAGITQQISPAEVIRGRLKELSAVMSHAPDADSQMPDWVAEQVDDSQPVDAELVDDDDDGDWLAPSNPWG